MPELQSNPDLQRVHRWNWPSITAVVFLCTSLLAIAGFWVGTYIVPAVLNGERPAPPRDAMQSVIKETPAVRAMAPLEESIQLAAAKAKLSAMVEASSPAPAAFSNASTNGTAQQGEVAALDRREPAKGPVASPIESKVPLPPRPHLSAAMVFRAVPLPPHRPIEIASPPDVTLPDRHAVQ